MQTWRYASQNYKDETLALKINKNCIAIGEHCSPKIVSRPGKLSGVSRNGPQLPTTQWALHTSADQCVFYNTAQVGPYGCVMKALNT